jgi:hypothetical protein
MAPQKRKATEAFGLITAKNYSTIDLQDMWRYGGVGQDLSVTEFDSILRIKIESLWQSIQIRYRFDYDSDKLAKDIGGTKNVAFRETEGMKMLRESLQKLKEWLPASTAAWFLYFLFELPARQFNAVQLFTGGLWEQEVVQKLCNLAVKNAPVTQKDMTLYRCVKAAFNGYARDGTLVTSTTMSKEIAFALSYGSTKRSGFFIYEIFVPKGSRVLPVDRFSYYPKQEEVLINVADNFKGTRFDAGEFGERYGLKYYRYDHVQILTNRDGSATIAEREDGDAYQFEVSYSAEGDTDYESADSDEENGVDKIESSLSFMDNMSPEEQRLSFDMLQTIEGIVTYNGREIVHSYVRLFSNEVAPITVRVDENGITSVYCYYTEIFSQLDLYWRLLSDRFRKEGKTVRLVLDFCTLLAKYAEKGALKWPEPWRGGKQAFLLTTEPEEAQVEMDKETLQFGLDAYPTGARIAGNYLIIKRIGITKKYINTVILSAQVLPGKTVDVVSELPIALLDSCVQAYDEVSRKSSGNGQTLYHLDVRVGPLKIVACDFTSFYGEARRRLAPSSISLSYSLPLFFCFLTFFFTFSPLTENHH